MSKLRIKRKTSKVINTRNGPATKYSFLCESERGGEQWVGAFSNALSDSWQEGMVVDQPVDKVEKDGNVYYNFKFERGGGGSSNVMQQVNEKLDRIITLLEGSKNYDDIPAEEDELPF